MLFYALILCLGSVGSTWIRMILAYWIQGAKYQPKTAKKTCLLFKPKTELLTKRDIIKFRMVQQVLEKI